MKAPAPLLLLSKLINQTRTERLNTFLARFENGYAADWAYRLPEHFKDSLDIRWTSRVKKGVQESCWTQGSRFDFREGYVIYDSPKGYAVWNEALQHINSVFQITKSSPAIPATNEPTTWPQRPDAATIKKHLSAFGQNYVSHTDMTKRNGEYTIRVQTKRFAGYLEVALLIPNENRTALMTKDIFPISQDSFVEWLITGVDPLIRKQQTASQNSQGDQVWPTA